VVGRETATKTKREVGRRIAELRAPLKLTQEALAERLGVSDKYIWRVEAGRQNLTIESMVRIARALRVPIASLFDHPRTSLARVRGAR
jgi:transcriptional regulator with XRE-family HTH domain